MAVSVLLVLKKNGERFREYSKIRQFDTKQIPFLMTCRPHYNSNWKKTLGFRNMQEKSEKKRDKKRLQHHSQL